jgi:hypothetical protein
MKLHSAQLHLLILKWLNQTTDTAVSSGFLDEMENLASKANSIRLFYIKIIRQLSDNANPDLKNLYAIGASNTDEIHPAGLELFTDDGYSPATHLQHPSFSSRLLHLLTGATSARSNLAFTSSYDKNIAGEKDTTPLQHVSMLPYQSTADQFTDLNNPAFRQWIYQWLTLTASTALDDNPSIYLDQRSWY